MQSKIFLITFYCCVITISQQSSSGSQCQGPSTVNCNCGVSSQEESASNQSINNRQGRPGRIGPIGKVGPKGQKVRKLDLNLSKFKVKLVFAETSQCIVSKILAYTSYCRIMLNK